MKSVKKINDNVVSKIIIMTNFPPPANHMHFGAEKQSKGNKNPQC